MKLGQKEEARQCVEKIHELKALQSGKTEPELPANGSRATPELDEGAGTAGMAGDREKAPATLPISEDIAAATESPPSSIELQPDSGPPVTREPPTTRKRVREAQTASRGNGGFSSSRLNPFKALGRRVPTGTKVSEPEISDNLSLKGLFLENKNEIKTAILVSLAIGFLMCVSLIVMESRDERYTQFYLLPGSFQSDENPFSNSSAFTYGVKSFEHEQTPYQLVVYAGPDVVQTRTFSLAPGEVREENVSFTYSNIALKSPIKINITLKSPRNTYDVHYWIAKRA